MGLCISAGGMVMALAAGAFSLGWTHSVERIRWEEHWEIRPQGLVLTLAIVRGSGAGMEIPEGAWLEGGAWHYRPVLPPLPELVLAASGATGTGWELCADGQCHALGAAAGKPLRLWPAAQCRQADPQ